VILGAALLVLVGLALFVGGILTGLSTYYWLCVLACGAAGVLLVLARARLSSPSPEDASAAPAQQGGPPAGTAVRDAADQRPEPLPPADGVPEAVEPAASSAEQPGQPEQPGQAGPPGAPDATHVHRGLPGLEKLRGDPPVEDVEVTDLLLVLDLHDEVLVVDEHPRYHLPGCRWLRGRATIPLPVDEARTDGFTPCARCTPDRTLAERERTRRAGPSG
jgi:hypothetical protein